MRSHPERLTVRHARAIALAAQGFADRRPTAAATMRHVRRALGRVGIVQIDSVNVVTRAHELPLWSRLGPYRRDAISDLAYRRRELFEYWGHAASYIPIELQPLLRWRMAQAHLDAWGGMRRIQRDQPDYVAAVLAEVDARGPLAASELTDGGTNRGPWWGWADGKRALEFLFWSGRVAVADRGPNFERRYDLTERIVPPDVMAVPTPPVEDAHRALLVHAARWHGIGTARCLADYFRIPLPKARPRLRELVEDGALIPVTVDGWKQPWFLDPNARRPRRIDAAALIGPFDSLVWERDRAEQLFGVRVVLEVYTPAPKRVHGYYVLPFLLGDELVARVDLKSDRKLSVLRVQAAHTTGVSSAGDAEVAAALAAELRAFAVWLQLDGVEVEPRGDLAAMLTRVLRSTNRGPSASSARSARSRPRSAPT